MSKKHFFLLVLVLCLIPSPLAGNKNEGDAPLNRLMKAKTLKCLLGRGCRADWSREKPDLEIGKWSRREENCVMIFDSIDLEKGTARFECNRGSADVTVSATSRGITFIEKGGHGSLFITTVFANYRKGSEDFIFVNSRHLSTPDGPMPSQFHGVCKILE